MRTRWAIRVISFIAMFGCWTIANRGIRNDIGDWFLFLGCMVTVTVTQYYLGYRQGEAKRD